MEPVLRVGYIPRDEVAALFREFWVKVRDDICGERVSEQDGGNLLVDQLIEGLQILANSHDLTWTYDLFDVSQVVLLYFGGSYPRAWLTKTLFQRASSDHDHLSGEQIPPGCTTCC